MGIRTVINTILIFAAVLLTVNLFFPFAEITGTVVTEVNAEPVCAFYNEGELSELPLPQCCYDLLKQYKCEEIPAEGEYDIRCYIAEDSERYFLLNTAMMSYCQTEGYDVTLH